MTVQNQAVSSANGLLYSWVTASPDWAASSFPGPGSALHIAVAMAPATPGSGGGVTDHNALTSRTDVNGHTWAELAQRPLSTYTAASNDAALADARKTIITTRGSAIALRIRLQSAVAWLAETMLGGINTGAGTLTLTAEGGVTLNGSLSVEPNGWWWAKRTAANVWHVFTGGGGGGGSSVTAGNGLTGTSAFSVLAENATIVVGASGIKRAAITGDGTIADGSNSLVIANLAWSKLAGAIGNLGFTGLKSLSYTGEVNNTGATPAINFTTGDLQKLTLSGNTTPTFVAPAGIGWVQVCAVGDGTQRTITWPGTVVGTLPAPTAGSGVRTFYPFFYDGTNYHYVASSGSSVTAGNGILDTSGTWSVKPDGATIGVSASGVKVADASIGNTQLSTGLSWGKLAAAIGDLAFTGLKFISYTAEYDNGNSGTADTITFANGLYQKSTLTGNCTFTFVAPTGVGEIQLKLIQDATGSRTVTWPATLIWPAGGAPTLSTTPGDIDIVSIYYDGTNYYGSISPEVPDGRVVRWDDAPAMSTTIPTGGGNIGVDPSLGLEWLGKYGVETTIAQHGDTGNTTKRRIVDWRTQPSRTTTTTIAQFTAASFDAVSFNGKALTNGALQVKARYVAHGLSGYTQSGEVLATVRIIAGAVAVGTFLDSFTATQGAAVFSAITIDASGTTVRLRPTADASALNVETFAFFQVTGFED